MRKIKPEQNRGITFCKVSIDNDATWIHGIITYINLEKKIAEIFLSARYFKNHLKEGQKILIKSFDNNNETLFSASITKKVISIRKQAITVNIDKVMSYHNKRRFERFYLNYPCKITYGDKEYIAILSDISLGGGMLFTDAEIDDHSIVCISIFISATLTINFIGKTVRKESAGNSELTYGIEILEIDEENNVLLAELINFLEEEKNNIAHEWRIFNMLKYSIYTISVIFIFVVIFFFFTNEAL
ncbi:PilZ domain-containing protein [Acetivibrio saccincola]|uniref:PilZ domain protein n=1 Tax=Acetivibrio saccincola TaxID=1677857 RepID=A0A2K9E1A6_9FIRM|nr:PilZ domain-containing protein [Acetivibrio saccincola]AUG57567.1 PilZ domain protein [Acetivibrio saccincola]HOA96475.1 PilZ domain-containing protein [Acetivibrio saccincola]HQD28749.1 PilZ domain-containing protein [Acetivibrio saccincola]